MAARSTQIVFSNHTDQPLAKLGEELPHGIWTDGIDPPDTVVPGATAAWQSESDGFATGTEGSVQYRIGSDGALFVVHWDNPFAGGNSYDEQVSTGWTVLRSGGAGENTRVDYSLERSGWHVTGFRPSLHGFRFSNSDWPKGTTDRTIDLGLFTLPIGDASKGLCGGMCYAALDYYLNGLPIPPQETRPPGEGDPLFDHIVTRLFDSFDIPAFPARLFAVMAPTYPDTDQGVLEPVGLMAGRSAIMIREAWPFIKTWVDAGVPAPLCLMKVKDTAWPGDFAQQHQVLVWGYHLDGTALSLAIYDPNKPKEDGVTLSLDISRTDAVVSVGANPAGVGPVHCFLPMRYQTAQPPTLS